MKKVVTRDSTNRTTEVQVFEVTDFVQTFTGTESPVKTTSSGKISTTLFDLVAESAKEVSSTITFGETIAARKLIFIDSDGKAYLATKSDVYKKASVVGMTIESGTSGQVKKFLVFGRIDNASFTFTGVDNLFLSTSGNITNVAPTTGHHKPVGQSLGVGSVFINVGTTTILGGV